MADFYSIEPHERLGVIYGLHDGDGRVRYVGKTVRLKPRITEHIIHSRDLASHRSVNPEVAAWINSISVLHVKLLEQAVPESVLDEREIYWIGQFDRRNLLNRNQGQARRGARSALATARGHRRFTPAQVTEIRYRVAHGASRAAVARDLGVSRDTIEKIVNRRTYP